MGIPLQAVEILFSDKSPDRLKTEDWSGKTDFWPTFQVFANRLILSETPFSGQRCEPIPNILYEQENFSKKLRE
jgi:hypothetical protein